MIRVWGCITQEHDLRLVALAACICALGCITTMILVARSQTVSLARALGWMTGAAAVLGCSVWSLHFVAMIAFMPGLPIAYDVQMTVASIVIAIAGALIALVTWRLSPPLLGSLIGGTAMGLAVSGMHYVGVAAMRLPGKIIFDQSYVTASIALGIGFSILALARADDLSRAWRRWETATYLSLAIAGVHFVGMSAITIEPGPWDSTGGSVLGTGALAMAVASVSLAILVVSLGAAMMEQHLSRRGAQELARMRLLSNFAQEALIIHRDGEILEVNQAGSRLLGMPPETIVGRSLFSLFMPSCAPILLHRFHTRPEDRHPEEMDLLTIGGIPLLVEVDSQSIDFRGKPATALAMRDLSDRKRNEAKIRHLAHHDALTDLPNRSLLQDRLTRALDDAAQSGDRMAILYLDLDRFKPVNDVLGHAGGDALLIAVSGRLVAELRSRDTVARVGGDEFVIVATDVRDLDRVSALATRLIQQISQPFQIEGRQAEIGVSIGVAIYPDDGITPETLLRAADTAMYRAKEEKRGSLRFFEASMDAQLQDRRLLEQDLRHATGRGEMALHYQPLLNSRTGDVEGFEALLRWQHPQRGLLSPGSFIPIAEEIGIIAQIGAWVIQAACEAAAGWAEPWRVAVNVSPVQFRQPGLSDLVADALAITKLHPSRLEIEITEGVFIEDADRAVGILSGLRALGVRLCLDDFGTGYSSLSYLRMFQFDNIKIDRSFVRDLDTNREAATIVSAIINLGHNLGLSVTVEGVETWQQTAFLLAQGSDQLQGFLLGRPAPEPVASELHRARIKSMQPGQRAAITG
jgi:diguanylate cyclase (GGDEF)-like protein/PAS domain S-box-containing protein